MASEEARKAEQLLPCPFCGGEASGEFFSQNAWSIFCDKCHASAAMCETKAEAIAAWNTRTPPKRVAMTLDEAEVRALTAETRLAAAIERLGDNT